MPHYQELDAGDPAPWFTQANTSNPNYALDTAAGRYLVLCFFLSSRDAAGRASLQLIRDHRALFDDERLAFFGISIDPGDKARVQASLPGIRFFWDFDYRVSRLYGAAAEGPGSADAPLRRFWMVLEPTMRVRAVFPFEPDGGERERVADYLKSLPAVDLAGGFPVQAPVIFLRNLFEPDLCRRLIALYDATGGRRSGVMRDVDGKSYEDFDAGRKRRTDCRIEDEELKALLYGKIMRRVAPEIAKVHQYRITQMERYLIGCYDGGEAGHFQMHRDNTSKAGEHRRFALSVNLNDDFDGGELSFPEYSSRTYKLPIGGACVFSCSLLHAVSPVRRGRRYAFLPFLHDDAAAKLRDENMKYFDERTVRQQQESRTVPAASATAPSRNAGEVPQS